MTSDRTAWRTRLLPITDLALLFLLEVRQRSVVGCCAVGWQFLRVGDRLAIGLRHADQAAVVQRHIKSPVVVHRRAFQMVARECLFPQRVTFKVDGHEAATLGDKVNRLAVNQDRGLPDLVGAAVGPQEAAVQRAVGSHEPIACANQNDAVTADDRLVGLPEIGEGPVLSSPQGRDIGGIGRQVGDEAVGHRDIEVASRIHSGRAPLEKGTSHNVSPFRIANNF